MHFLNNPTTIGHSFYSKPSDLNGTNLEYLYNYIHGVIPTMIHFADKFNVDCIAEIEKNFSRLYTSVYKMGDSCVDEAIWAGNPDTVYNNTFLSLRYKNEDFGNIFGDTVFSHSTRSAKSKLKLLKDAYVLVRAACMKREHMQHIAQLLKGYEINEEGSIYMLTSQYGDLTLTAMPLVKKTTDLALNYGEEFIDVHNSIVESLNSKASGLYLFHGDPGTGKSSYIKHLLSGVINRKIAYVPVGLINHLVSPEFLPLLMEHKDIILVIEDAEQALLSRETSDNSTLTQTLLNLTDGIVGDALNVSVIATFNTGKERLDTALLRKGRLKKSHEFKPLSEENAKKLAESIGKVSADINSPMTLADIYNLEEVSGYVEPEKKRVGFH